MRKRFTNFILEEFFFIFNPVFFGLLILNLSLQFARLYEKGGIDLPFEQLTLSILLLLPSIALLIIPIAFLIATSITITKLSSTSELTALQTTGISPYKIFKIFAAISFILIVITLFLSLFVKPYSNYVIKQNMDLIAKGKIIAVPQEKIIKKVNKDTYLYVEDAEDDVMSNVILFSSREDKETMIIAANTCSIDAINDVNIFKFRDGNYVSIDKNNITTMNFDDMTVNPFYTSTEGEYDINRRALPTFLLIKRLLNKQANPAATTEVYHRFFFPLSIFVFLLLAFPLSFGHSRNYKTTGIIVSMLISLIFYLIFALFNTLAVKGIVHPLFGFMLTIVVLAGCGFILCRKKRIFS